LFEAEVEYLRGIEWARTTEDILWRRTKLGLHVGPDTVAALRRHMGD
jgi:glycerol-3-phosphate dehydrogenase